MPAVPCDSSPINNNIPKRSTMLTTDHEMTPSRQVGGSIVVFAKCPIPGTSKTRLAPLLGSEGAASLAEAMLSDIIVSLSACPALKNTTKVIVYAPGTKSAELQLISVIQSLDLNCQSKEEETSVNNQQYEGTKSSNSLTGTDRWHLLPMMSSTKPSHIHGLKSDLTSSTLGDKLADALVRTRELRANITKNAKHGNTAREGDGFLSAPEDSCNEGVLFLGMDSPELPLEEIIYGLQLSSASHATRNTHQPTLEAHDKYGSVGKAHLCPADDGGYGLLSVPGNAPSHTIFSGVRWSNPLTAVSQLKALTDSNVEVSIGKMMYDVDEPGDVKSLATRLINHQNINAIEKSVRNNESGNDDVLTSFCSGIPLQASISHDRSECKYTWKTLLDLGVVIKEPEGSRNTCFSETHVVNEAIFNCL